MFKITPQIWKLQRPLASNSPEIEILAYTEDEEDRIIFPACEDCMKKYFGDEYKIYVIGFVDKEDDSFRVVTKVKDQDW